MSRPSLRSHVFRLLTRALSARMDRTSSVAELRALMAGTPKQPLPRGVTTRAAMADGAPVEWIEPAEVASHAVVLYLHGGGWILGWYPSHRNLVAHICEAAACRAVAVEYRLAPEHPFPAALEDCVTAYRWLVASGTKPQQIVIAGDSAGGNLVLTTLMSLRDAGDPLPAAAVCLSPMTDLAGTGESLSRGRDALLTVESAMSMAKAYVGDQDPRSPLISPQYGDLTGLPRLLVQVGADEILLSDSLRLAEHAKAAGVDVDLAVWPGMWHVWHTLAPYLPEARQAVDAIGVFVREACIWPDTAEAVRP
jgi:monoterpene epsilon-lactone hydrolase